jgi:hypothetical protein
MQILILHSNLKCFHFETLKLPDEFGLKMNKFETTVQILIPHSGLKCFHFETKLDPSESTP